MQYCIDDIRNAVPSSISLMLHFKDSLQSWKFNVPDKSIAWTKKFIDLCINNELITFIQ